MKLIPFDGMHGVIHLNPYAVSSVELDAPNPRPGLGYDEMRKLRLVRINMLDGDAHFSAELETGVAEDLRDDFLRRLEAWGLPEKEFAEAVRGAADAARGDMDPCDDDDDIY